MSGGNYYQQQQQQQHHHQGYGSHYQQESSEPPQYLHQNYGYNQNQGFVPPYQNNPAFVPVSEEYLRQPAQSPFPTAPVQMPEPPTVLRITEPPPAASQPAQVIIVQHPSSRNEGCCGVICGCIGWLIARICYVILTFILTIVFIGLAVWLINKYRGH